MADSALSFRVPAELREKLEELAEATDRPKSWHLERALESYVELELWQVRHIQEAIAEADAGYLIPHEQVVKEMERHMRNRRKRTGRK